MVQGNYMRNAPIRRLRHPLEENPLWSILGSAFAGILALVVGLPVLLVVCILIPFCLLGRWLLLFIFWNRQTSAATQGTDYTLYIYIRTPKCICTHAKVNDFISHKWNLWEIKSIHNCNKFYIATYDFMVPVQRLLQQCFLYSYSNIMVIVKEQFSSNSFLWPQA
jgi:hypothetical protein